MNPIDPHDADELVTAYIDDEATPSERAQVEADPDLMARVEVLRSVAAMIAEPVGPPPSALRDQHIAAAIEASATTPVVTSLSLARRARSLRYSVVLGAAAAILVAFLVATVVLATTDDGNEDLATSIEESAELDELSSTDSGADAGATTAGDEGGSAADAAAESMLEAPASDDLDQESAADMADGEVFEAEESSDDTAGAGAAAGDLIVAGTEVEATTPAGFAAAIADLLDDDDLSPTPGVADRQRIPCEETLVDITASFGTSVLAGTGTIDSDPVQYVVVTDDDVSVLFIVGEAPACDVIDEIPLR